MILLNFLRKRRRCAFMSILESIQSLCKQKNISIPSLEKELNFGRGSIYKWDKNSPSIDKIQKVADYFNVSLDRIIYGFNRTEFTSLVNYAKGNRTIDQFSKDTGVDKGELNNICNGSISTPPNLETVKKIALDGKEKCIVSEYDLLESAGFPSNRPIIKDYEEYLEMLSKKFYKAGFLITFWEENGGDYVHIGHSGQDDLILNIPLHEFLENGVKIHDELVEKYKKDEHKENPHDEKYSVEDELLTIVARQLGHKRTLTKEQLNRIKFAIKLSLVEKEE
ncbi:helix-turn-helix domain protein [Paenibacillus phage HB10c2]|uniref:Helix-turn-helix domain protein n=8 Tax=root TaxID=1 RepID=A0A0B5A036_9CAUD|nr:transcriptional regulator [Paenibacillus phage HB10c2]YP_009838867.1 transcriptional regulator [Paenibacillus phage Eltigre]PCK70659.1 hypothetical protein PL1_3339 [Paenibacillus larvae subsp. larvae B-3650]QVV19773.1 helix-turn-helix domain protein [Paenibacillus phage JackPlaque]AJD83042.1 helix-turn-helix domain protein [Paenibacillus phage HB10c2]AXF40111.1 helix-turn-helix domain Cro/C1-type transcriptional regulator [Paenibacillus phage Eltigre]